MTMVSTRSLELLGGLLLLVAGGLVAVGTAIAHLAWALPLGELPFRPTLVQGGVIAVLGAGLVLVARRQPAPAPAARPHAEDQLPLRLAS